MKFHFTCSIHLVCKVIKQLEVVSALQASSYEEKTPLYHLAKEN